MRILIVSQYFWPEGFRINEITQSLMVFGHEVDVLTGKPNYPAGIIYPGYSIWRGSRDYFHGANINRVPLFPRGQNSRLRLAINYISFIFFGSIYGPWLLLNKKYDVIFVYGLSPILLALPGLFISWLKRVPLVIWVQDLWPQSLSATGLLHNNLIIWVVEHVVRFIYRRSNLLLVQSPAFIDPVRQLASQTPIIYYPNSVGNEFSNPVSYVNGQAIPGLDESFTVLFAGNIGFAQAVDVIVNAAILLKDYPDIRFVILGDGSRREWMIQQVKQHSLMNLYLPGRFPVEAMPGAMRKASVLLVTLADRETFNATIPSKVQAYMAAGRPIIACMNGVGGQLVQEAKAGFSVSAEDHEGLANAVLRMYELSEIERDEMASNAKAYYRQHFDHDMLVKELIGHFQKVGVSNK